MRVLIFLAAVALATLSTASTAATSLFQYKSNPGGPGDFTFTVDTHPTARPIDPYEPDDSFAASNANATGTFAGQTSAIFSSTNDYGGLASGNYAVSLAGPQLYSGTVNAPAFEPGSYFLSFLLSPGGTRTVSNYATVPPLTFSYMSNPGGPGDFSFTVATSPVSMAVDPYEPDDIFSVPIANATGTFAGQTSAVFSSRNDYGGVASGDYTVDLAGPQLYSGTVRNPVFQPGSYFLGALFSSGGTLDVFYDPATGMLATSSVPEAASWLSMIAGFGAIGGCLRRHARPSRGHRRTQGVR